MHPGVQECLRRGNLAQPFCLSSGWLYRIVCQSYLLHFFYFLLQPLLSVFIVGGAAGGGVLSHLWFSYWSVYQESVQSDVSSQRASPAVVGGQTGAKPTSFAGVGTRKGRAYARTFFSRIKWETKWSKKLFFQWSENSHNSCIGRQWSSSFYTTVDEFYAWNKYRTSSSKFHWGLMNPLPVTGLQRALQDDLRESERYF